MMLVRSFISKAQFSTEPVHGDDQQLADPMSLLLPKPQSIPVQMQYQRPFLASGGSPAQVQRLRFAGSDY